MNRRIRIVVQRLLAVRTELGSRVFQDAVTRALLGIAVAAHIEAERRARQRRRQRSPPPPASEVIPFPLAKARANQGLPSDSDASD